MMEARALHRESNAEPEIRIAPSSFAARPFERTFGDSRPRIIVASSLPSQFSFSVGDFAPMARDRE